MKCNYPVGTYRTDGTPAYRPCGSCIGCRLDYAKSWSIRCLHEASLHEENCFITLTYNNESLPEDRSVHKYELSKFIRSLRKKIEPNKIRFYGCGEYGDNFGRPHYHACIFGYSFPDKEILHYGTFKRFRKQFRSGLNHDLFTSRILEKTWKKGFCTLGDLTEQSAGYVARYCTKKITGDMAKDHYQGKHSEFALMSRRPGIGAPWVEKFHTDIYPKDFYTVNGIKYRPPRFYDAWYEAKYPKRFKEVKEKRRKLADSMPYESDWRGHQKELYRKKVTKPLQRRLEDGRATTAIRDSRHIRNI